MSKMSYPYAMAVSPLENSQLMVTFENGEKRIFNVEPYIKGSWFSELRDPSYFASVHIGGLSIEWANGQDIGPDDLYFESVPIAE